MLRGLTIVEAELRLENRVEVTRTERDELDRVRRGGALDGVTVAERAHCTPVH